MKNNGKICFPVFHTSGDIFLHVVTFHMFSTLNIIIRQIQSKVKTEISVCMAIMLDHP